MIIEIDRNIYSDSCISKTIYWLSNSYSCERKFIDGREYIDVIPTDKTNNVDEATTKFVFLQVLNDYKLREIVREETKDINTILYLKAFADCNELLEDEQSSI